MIISEFVNVMTVNDKKGKKITVTDRYSSVIIIPLYGKIKFSFNDKTIISDSNTPIFIPQGAEYINECLEESKSLLFNFQIFDASCDAKALSPISTAEEYYKRIEETAIRGLEYELMANLYQLLAELFLDNKKTKPSDKFANEAVKIMLANYQNPKFNCRCVAEELNISKIYLRKLFAGKYNTSPLKYLTGIRMKNASAMLKEQRSVSETALKCGYSDIYQFSRAYKKYFGYPPSKIK